MNVESNHSPESMLAAECWVSRLQWGNCTPEELEAFDAWRARAEHAAAYEAADMLWRSFGQLEGSPDLARLSRRILERTDPAARRAPGRRFAWAVAASVAVCTLTGAAFWFGRFHISATTYATEAGQRSTFRLADGSQITLNASTRVDVRLSDGERRLTLRNGEAIFSVAEDRARPFTVNTADGMVTALGTRFQVRNLARDVVVTLLDGCIAVEREARGQHLQLYPGEQVRFREGHAEIARRVVDPEVVSSWEAGRLRFKHSPLAEVLEEVNRYSAAKIGLADAGLDTVAVNGAFDIGDTASVVSALEGLLSLEVSRQTPSEIVLRKRRAGK